VGVVHQSPFLLATHIRNNLLLGLRRPSQRALRDQDGEIDIQSLPGVETEADLNRELIKVVKAVGLDLDVLRKALDGPVPETWRKSALVCQLEQARQRVSERLGAKWRAALIPLPTTVLERVWLILPHFKTDCL